MAAAGADRWVLVVPVKDTQLAKSRLAGYAGSLRPELARAMAADTVAAALNAPLVDTVVVVTDDAVAAAELSALGANVVPDEPRAGLNAALEHGAQLSGALSPGCGVGAMSADLPALRSSELSAALAGVPVGRRCFVADAAGTGTTVLLAAPGVPLAPAFGAASAAAHRSSGATELRLPGFASLRLDVDTAEDLRTATGLGVGPRTRAVLARLPPPVTDPDA